MRILANYGYKNNGDSYQVTFETMGDVPKEQSDAVVDQLFALAKAAIERQLNPTPEEEEVIIPEPRKQSNGNGKNGNGKPIMKNPEAPITAKQKQLIIRLAKEKGDFIEGLNDMSMGEASSIIENLLSVTV
jgi:hypothetical protein